MANDDAVTADLSIRSRNIDLARANTNWLMLVGLPWMTASGVSQRRCRAPGQAAHPGPGIVIELLVGARTGDGQQVAADRWRTAPAILRLLPSDSSQFPCDMDSCFATRSPWLRVAA